MDRKLPPRTDNETDPPSPVEQLRMMAADVKTLAAAEIDYAKARLTYSGGIIRKAGIWALIALLFLTGAVIALILGLLLIVAHYFGPWVALIVVVSAFGFAALGAALYARQTARNLRFEDEDDQR
ncbi:MAG: phage holin family protein [Sphingorhabdus sp.]